MSKTTYFYLKITEVHEDGEETSSEFSGSGPLEMSTGAEHVEGKYVAVVSFKGTIEDVCHTITTSPPSPNPDPEDLLSDYNPSPAAARLGVMKFNIEDEDGVLDE